MSSTTESLISIEALKRHAKRLQKEIKKINPDFKLSEAQDLLAKTFGLNNWHEMNETTKKNEEEKRLKKEFLQYCENGHSTFMLQEHKNIQFDIEKALRIATKNGHGFIIFEVFEEYLPQHPEKQISKHTMLYLFTLACHRGHLDIIQYLLDYYKRNELLDQFIGSYGFQLACRNGHYDIIQYLLEESTIKDRYNHQQIIDQGFLNATFGEALNGVFGKQHTDIIKYLLNSKNIPINANINAQDSKAIKDACISKELMQYFLCSPELKEHGNIYARNGKIFEFIYNVAHSLKDYEIIDYIIGEYKIEKTPEIIKTLDKYAKIRKVGEKHEC